MPISVRLFEVSEMLLVRRSGHSRCRVARNADALNSCRMGAPDGQSARTGEVGPVTAASLFAWRRSMLADPQDAVVLMHPGRVTYYLIQPPSLLLEGRLLVNCLYYLQVELTG
ncbi:hypothetical protein HPB50_016428 [Hyalomma asiaticum]|uniref:Uncharacterized protein n=1 Tax=Hyalomma asiaticum TaxID=266040 RepID=A0ACB7SIG4_HYAAI|nr:hypothetical protein HPB50_016428 [Hyalomma asiaticum]